VSVRRLAEEQPGAFAFTAANEKWAREKIKNYPEGRQASAILPILMRAQEQEGWVTRPMLEYVAGMLDMPYIRALEIATFYTQFQLQPVGSRGHVQVCGTTPCMLRGAEELIAVCRRKIAREPFHRNPAGTLSWEEVECVGACVNAPVVLIGKDTYEDLTPARFSEIVDAFSAGQGATVPAGPQVKRQFSAQASGPTTLLQFPSPGAATDGGTPPAPKKPRARLQKDI
jgi:NADH-quinone oxidoreductase subunit E